MNNQSKTQKNSSNKNSKKNWIVIAYIFITTLVIGAGVYAWQNLVFKETEQSLVKQIDFLEKQLEVSKQEQPGSDKSSNELAESIIQISDNKNEVILKENPIDSKKTDIYLKNTDNNSETLFATINDVFSSLTNIKSSVAPNEKIIVFENNNVLTFINQNGTVLGTYELINIGHGLSSYPELGIELSKWSSDGTVFWGNLFHTYSLEGFYKVHINSWTINNYETSSLGISNDYDLNENNGEIIYSNYPVFFVAGDEENYQNSGTKLNLNIYNLETKNKQLISTSISKKFEPKWIDENTIEYNDPNSEQRIQKIIDNNFELNEYKSDSIEGLISSTTLNFGEFKVNISNFESYTRSNLEEIENDTIFIEPKMGFELSEKNFVILPSNTDTKFEVSVAFEQTLRVQVGEKNVQDLNDWFKLDPFLQIEAIQDFKYKVPSFEREKRVKDLESDFSSIKHALINLKGEYIDTSLNQIQSIERLPINLWASRTILRISMVFKDGSRITKFIVNKGTWGC